MSRKEQDIQEADLRGFKHFQKLSRLLTQLHAVGCARDRAGNRLLHLDQYVTLLRLGQ